MLFFFKHKILTKIHTSLCSNFKNTYMSNFHRIGVPQLTTHYQHTTVTNTNNWNMLLLTSWACISTFVLSTDFPEHSDVLVTHYEHLSKLIFTDLKICLWLESVKHLNWNRSMCIVSFFWSRSFFFMMLTDNWYRKMFERLLEKSQQYLFSS